MKTQITRKTKIKIRKAVAFARNLLLAVFGICTLLGIMSVDGNSLLFPAICFIIGFVCFGISFILDQLLWQTAWKGDKPSPFMH